MKTHIPPRIAKDALYEHFARIGKALASPKRIEMLELLSQGERPVELLARETGLSFANASQHLRVLRTARLVETRKNGVQVLYSLATPEVATFLRSLGHLAESLLAEVAAILGDFHQDKNGFDAVSQSDLLKRIRRKEVIVIDVRPRVEFEAGHLRGAVSAPMCELDASLRRLPKDRDIVAYCRGPYCVLAAEAAHRLRSKGFRAFWLRLGVTDLREHGFKVMSDRGQ